MASGGGADPQVRVSLVPRFSRRPGQITSSVRVGLTHSGGIATGGGGWLDPFERLHDAFAAREGLASAMSGERRSTMSPDDESRRRATSRKAGTCASLCLTQP